MSKLFFRGWVGVIFLSLLLLEASAVLAQAPKPTPTPCQTGPNGEVICSLENPIASGETDVVKIIGRVLKAVIGMVGAVALLMFLFGSGDWLLSGGNPDKVKKGAQTMLWAAIGILVVLGSYFIVDLVFKAFVPR